MTVWFKYLFLVALAACLLGFDLFRERSQSPTVPFVLASKKDLFVTVKSIGEIESARSITVASPLKSDLAKIIYLIPDGEYVENGQLLIKVDPTPFEEKCEKLRLRVKEQKAVIDVMKQTLEWEMQQAQHKNIAAELEEESAVLEIEKMTKGDGQGEILRLKSLMQKAFSEYEELMSYAADLSALQEEGFLNNAEIKQIEKKVSECKETYEMAKQHYESFVTVVHPLQIKKGETQLKRQQVLREEIRKNGLYAVAKASAQLEQSKQVLRDEIRALNEAKKELLQTDICAPSSGMVVLREEFRSGQKRKPRVGDLLVKNQPLIELPNFEAMVVKTRIREVDLYKIEVGKEALVEVDAYPSLRFSGKVVSIGVLAVSDFEPQIEEKSFEVVVSLDESDKRLRPGMTARVTLFSTEKKGVLAIPVQSVFDEEKNDFCVVCGPRDTFEKRLVQLGISNDQWIEVISGLDEGEVVCLINPLY